MFKSFIFEYQLDWDVKRTNYEVIGTKFQRFLKTVRAFTLFTQNIPIFITPKWGLSPYFAYSKPRCPNWLCVHQWTAPL